MSEVFKNQSLLTIVVETGYAGLASATVTKILYTKPKGQSGVFPGTVAGTTLTYAVQDADIDQHGTWQFQAYCEIGGLKAYGDIDTQIFKPPLQ